MRMAFWAVSLYSIRARIGIFSSGSKHLYSFEEIKAAGLCRDEIIIYKAKVYGRLKSGMRGGIIS